MKTDDLIATLATGAGCAPRAPLARRLAPALALALPAAALASIAAIGSIPRELWAAPAPWVKLVYAAAVVAAAAGLVSRLARPGAPWAGAGVRLGAVFSAMGLLGVLAWTSTPDGERAAALLGHSALRCPWAIVLLSLPALAGTFWSLRRLAPTRLRLSGMAAGLLAGAAGAAGYALACTETSMAFVAIWYNLGIALAGALGAALGPRLLRW